MLYFRVELKPDKLACRELVTLRIDRVGIN